MKHISRFILFRLLGWEIINDFPKLKKYVIIVAPHTSWVDFPMALLVKFIKGLQVNYVGKASLFKWPYGFFFRYFGGRPVDRSKNTNKVQAIVDLFKENEAFIFALAPEGTRQKVGEFKTGFYHIAKGAQVPIVMTSLDFKNKQIKISDPFYTTSNKEADFEYIYGYFRGIKGKKPELSL